ncbi:unnamed protein product [Brassica napus]|uniref:(rape) hypothetical protein n=1 Tax=Brassica napus TaxID=3708 RepID=A0A816S9N6_BRANA|nr:unnamed protein product [Brassica napus]
MGLALTLSLTGTSHAYSLKSSLLKRISKFPQPFAKTTLRLKKLEELEAATHSLKSRSNEQKQIRATKDNVRLGLRRISTLSFYNETLTVHLSRFLPLFFIQLCLVNYCFRSLILSNVSLLLMAITDRSIFAVAMLITFMGLNMDGLGLPGSLTKSQPTELLQQPKTHFSRRQGLVFIRELETDTLLSKITPEVDQQNQHYHGNCYRGYH